MHQIPISTIKAENIIEDICYKKTILNQGAIQYECNNQVTITLVKSEYYLTVKD